MLTPEQIIANKRELSVIAPTTPGIYFLIDGDKIVYIGRAIDIRKRLREHKRDGVKVYTHYAFVWCDAGDLIDTEADYITVFKPSINLPVHSRRWMLLSSIAMYTRTPVEYYREYAERRGLTAINNHYCLADFAEFHAKLPYEAGVLEEKRKMSAHGYASWASGVTGYLYVQLGIIRPQDIRWTFKAARAELVRLGVWCKKWPRMRLVFGDSSTYDSVMAEVFSPEPWPAKHKYDVLELDAIAQGNTHGDVRDELFPQQAHP